MLRQHLCAAIVHAGHTAQVLFAKARVGLPAQQRAQAGVIAQFRVRVQGQVVGVEVDIVGQQALQALLHPAGDAPVLPAPEQAVVHKEGVGLLRNGCVDQRTAGGHAADDARNLRLALDLQAVGAVVLEAFGLQERVQGLQQGVSVNGHGRIVLRRRGGRLGHNSTRTLLAHCS